MVIRSASIDIVQVKAWRPGGGCEAEVVESGDELADVDDAVVTRAGRDGLLRTIDVNSFQALEDTTKPVSSLSIVIVVERDDVLPGFEIDGPVNGFTVTDNGVGFTEDNLNSFFTSDTQYKVGRGGKGIGRFLWLNVWCSDPYWVCSWP